MAVKRYDDMNAKDVNKFLSPTSRHKTDEKVGKEYYGKIWSNFTDQVVVKLERIKHFIKTLFTKGSREWINNSFVADKIKELSNKTVKLEGDIQGKDINKIANDIKKLDALCLELDRTVVKGAKIGQEKKIVGDLQREMGEISKWFNSLPKEITASKNQIVPSETGEAPYAGINVVKGAEPTPRKVRREGKRGQILPATEQEKEKPVEEPPQIAPKVTSLREAAQQKKADELIARGTKLEDDKYFGPRGKAKLKDREGSPLGSQEFVGNMKQIHERDAAIAKGKGKVKLEKHEPSEVQSRQIEPPKPIEVTKEHVISQSEEQEVSTEQLQETNVQSGKVSIEVIRGHIKHLLEKILENKGINKALGSAIWSEGSDITKLKGFKEKLYTPKSAIELDLNEIERLLKKAKSKDKDKTNDIFYDEALRGVDAIRELIPRLGV